MRETGIRRRPDGTIDADRYLARARTLRAEAVRAGAGRLATMLSPRPDDRAAANRRNR